jgi:thioredoxin 1
MMIRKFAIALLVAWLALNGLLAQESAASENPSFTELPVKGQINLVDLGADKCIPCKMMAPILEELKEEYKGKAAIVFVDVWKNREAVGHFGIKAIPTQIFYDSTGKEVFRHMGFMGKENIVMIFKGLGLELPADTK